jgi:hypothetical protein
MNNPILSPEPRTESAVSGDVRLGTARGAHVFLNITETPIPAAKVAVEAAEAKVAEAAEGAPKEAAEAELKGAEEALEAAETAKINWQLDAKDPVSGVYYSPYQGGALDTVTAAELQGELDEGPVIFVINADPAPNVFRVQVLTDEGAEWTYSVGASPIR